MKTKTPKKISEFTDRELQEAIYKSLRQNESDTKGMSTWIQIWSWLSAIGLVGYLLFELSKV